MTHAHVHRNERIRRVPKSMLPPRSSGPVAEGALPLFSRWHRSGNLWEPLNPGELVGSHPSGGSATPWHPAASRDRPTYVGRVPRGHRSQGLADPADRWTDFQLGNRNCWPALLQMQDRAVRLEENVKMFGNWRGVSGDPSPTASKASVFWRRYLNSVSAHL